MPRLRGKRKRCTTTKVWSRSNTFARLVSRLELQYSFTLVVDRRRATHCQAKIVVSLVMLAIGSATLEVRVSQLRIRGGKRIFPKYGALEQLYLARHDAARVRASCATDVHSKAHAHIGMRRAADVVGYEKSAAPGECRGP